MFLRLLCVATEVAIAVFTTTNNNGSTNIHYLDEGENDLYPAWLDALHDRVAKIAVIRRVARM